jgi:hypothetical protein
MAWTWWTPTWRSHALWTFCLWFSWWRGVIRNHCLLTVNLSRLHGKDRLRTSTTMKFTLSFLKRSRDKPNQQGEAARALEGWPWVLWLPRNAKWLASTLNSQHSHARSISYPVQMDTVVFINHCAELAIQRRMFRCHCGGSTGCFHQFHLMSQTCSIIHSN